MSQSVYSINIICKTPTYMKLIWSGCIYDFKEINSNIRNHKINIPFSRSVRSGNLLLGLPSTVVLGSKSCRTHNHILLSHTSESLATVLSVFMVWYMSGYLKYIISRPLNLCRFWYIMNYYFDIFYWPTFIIFWNINFS